MLNAEEMPGPQGTGCLLGEMSAGPRTRAQPPRTVKSSGLPTGLPFGVFLHSAYLTSSHTWQPLLIPARCLLLGETPDASIRLRADHPDASEEENWKHAHVFSFCSCSSDFTDFPCLSPHCYYQTISNPKGHRQTWLLHFFACGLFFFLFFFN